MPRMTLRPLLAAALLALITSTVSIGAAAATSPLATPPAAAPPAAATNAPLSPSPRIYAGSGVLPYGDAAAHGSPSGITLNSLMTGMARTSDGRGYWLVGADGGVFSYGDAGFHGSAGSLHLVAPVVGIASTPDGQGYWLVAADGGVFSFGDAAFYGSMGGKPLNAPVVGIVSTPDGKGYWLVAADGGIFSFGDARFQGSMGGHPLNSPMVGIASTPDGNGYWMVAADGGIFTFGDAPFEGSLGSNTNLPASIVGMAVGPGGKGYWLAGAGGGVYAFGDAKWQGQSAGALPLSPVAAIVPTPDGGGYWLLEPDDWNYSFADASPYELSVSQRIVSVAASQVQGDPDAGQGKYCNPYGPCEEWCALFASWVWRQGGIEVPSYAFTGDLYYWAQDYGAVLAPDQLPAPGDAVLYGTGPATVDTSVHVGIVAQVWPNGDIVTVEGDAGPDPSGSLAVVVNGPYLPVDSLQDNGFGVYAFAQPVR